MTSDQWKARKNGTAKEPMYLWCCFTKKGAIERTKTVRKYQNKKKLKFSSLKWMWTHDRAQIMLAEIVIGVIFSSNISSISNINNQPPMAWVDADSAGAVCWWWLMAHTTRNQRKMRRLWRDSFWYIRYNVCWHKLDAVLRINSWKDCKKVPERYKETFLTSFFGAWTNT